jgi:hypothetical protein
MTAPQENQTMVSRETKATRAELKQAATRQPQHAHAYKLLSKQLRNYENGNTEEKAALWPVILDSVKLIKATHGR